MFSPNSGVLLSCHICSSTVSVVKCSGLELSSCQLHVSDYTLDFYCHMFVVLMKAAWCSDDLNSTVKSMESRQVRLPFPSSLFDWQNLYLQHKYCSLQLEVMPIIFKLLLILKNEIHSLNTIF